MKQILRILLAAIGILGVVAVAAVVYVTTFLDPEDFKPRLTAVVEEHTGLNIELDGALSWSFYPRIGVSVEKTRAWLAEQDAEAPAFAAVDRAEVSVAFAPLLRGEIAVDGLTLDGMRLNLRRNEQGEGNWEPLLERLAERDEQAETVLAPASAGPNADAGSLDVALSIASVQIKNADIRFRDAQSDTFWHAEKLNVTGNNVNPERSFPLKAMFTLSRHDSLDGQVLDRPPAISSDINLDTRIKLALAEHRFMLENPKLTTSSRLDPDTKAQALTLGATRIDARLEDKQLSVTDGVLETTLHHPETWDGGLALALKFALEGNWGEQTASINEMQLTGPDGLRASGQLQLENWLSDLRYAGNITLAPLSLRPWLGRMGVTLDTRNPGAFSDVALTSPVEGSAEEIRFPQLSLVLDDTTLTGNLGAAFDATALDFDLQGDTLNVDRYLPAKAPKQAGLGVLRQALAQDNDPEQALVPQSLLATLDLDGALALETLTLGGLTFDKPQLSLKGRDGTQRLSAFEAGFYDGTLSATGSVNARETPLEWALAPQVASVKMAPLLEALGERDAPLSGRLNASGKLTTQGNTRADLLRRLNGSAKAGLNDGAIAGVNVSRQMCEAVATLEGRKTSREWHEDTRFEHVDATFSVRDGVVSSDDMLVTLPGIDVRGEGEYDLGRGHIDALANARLVNTADAACRVNPRLEKLALPVRCEGDASKASSEWCHIDRDALKDNVAGLVGDEVGNRIEEKLNEKLGEGATKELRDGLKRLFD
ncbi:AsmA family protein [Vreelandella subglaciescola]|jgi:AsmA protein|uniref:AsmA protein n=1 Tax=Vreelandella subglaciescola TaxID=29571 RepID=A0A1M7HQ65_9GAMM|nr:AsmA family protein [Halomonas subglaciescola]SHM30624.1 AsmA protein [Halomonas subglaciescola]